jgi:DNA polymerase elongation subunit (family B)
MTLLNVSATHQFWQGKEPEAVAHHPAFLAFPKGDETVAEAHARLLELVKNAGDAEVDSLGKIHKVLAPITYKSFWDHGKSREVIPVESKRPYWVPEITEALFYDHDFYTCEHDIPYRERLLADICAENDDWLLDTKGEVRSLTVLTYDIETTQYAEGKKDIPIDMLGYSEFEVKFQASKNLETEAFDFKFVELPNDWATREIVQEMAKTLEEEIDMLDRFTRKVVQYDIVAGHNILGFDNLQIHERLRTFLRRNEREQFLTTEQVSWFEEFTTKYSRKDRSFHFGTSSDIAVWYPMTLDTFHAARKFYFFHDDFTLKGLAPWLGINVEGRKYIDFQDMKLDEETLKYNEHDVREQLGITQSLIAQALPLCFTVNLPMDELLTGGNTRMWDHMALLRARRERKIMPATSRALQVCRSVQRALPGNMFPTRIEVAEAASRILADERNSGYNKEFVRVAKQGPEMPFWVEHPRVMANPNPQGEQTGYDIVGGLTLKPDSDLKSHFIPWYNVVEADVGAMYPTILKAQNLTADTVQPAVDGETPDDWIWLDRLDPLFVENPRYQVRKPLPEETFTKGRGWMIGIKKNPEEGMVNKAMTGILDTIQKVKDALAEAKHSGAPKDEVRIHAMTYASLKAARNAGTHGILVAVNVSCRQFNMWGGATITTVGQKILHETREDFERRGIRVVYGDTDGIYLGCSKSVGNVPRMAAALGADELPEADNWITMPEDALKAVQEMNDHWRKFLNYPGFELEAEQYDAMVYVVHKNYLKFSTKDGKLVLETKGNNFKGSDKAPLAQSLLAEIMERAIKDVSSWDEEEDARERMKVAIKRATIEIMKDRDVTGTEWSQLTLRQSVRPIRGYKPNPDGSASSFAMRTAAIEQVLGEELTAGRKMKFIVCKNPLPAYIQPPAQEWARKRLRSFHLDMGIKKPNKSGIKPIEYMWPLDLVEAHMIDLTWYKDMVEKYIMGAFGFNSLELATQRDLSSWF